MPEYLGRPPIEVEQAEKADTTGLIQILAKAFQTEPAFSFIIPDAVQRERRLPKAFAVIVGEDMKKGRIFKTSIDAAATMWRAPGRMRDNKWDEIRTAIPYLLAFGDAIGRGAKVAALITKNLPDEDCWYLHYAGCVPAYQGKGMGGAVIREGLAAVDSERSKAYLETADEANLAIYQSLGFAIIKTWKVPDGPQFWGMMRAARG